MRRQHTAWRKANQAEQILCYFAGTLSVVVTDDNALVQISHSETGTRPISTANTQVAETRQTPATSKSNITCRFDKLNEGRCFWGGLCSMGGRQKCPKIELNLKYMHFRPQSECGKLSQVLPSHIDVSAAEQGIYRSFSPFALVGRHDRVTIKAGNRINTVRRTYGSAPTSFPEYRQCVPNQPF
ncbi:hypothetical protein [Herbaspirillum rhizosphaerae]|uniref:hypothetical protein n=1 Tax=Herbaspirillum rhizosphaerae TaxID=346179 RepID=UPI000AB2065C|nr:hypothetical protein [Herbaspirillum rhizosphaerae]